MTHTPTAILAALHLLVFSPLALAQPGFVSSETPAPEWPEEIHYADVDGDGLTDIIIPRYSPGAGRQLHIHQQLADHRFPMQPSRVVDIRPEIVAVAFADLRPEPGQELLLYTGSTVFSLSTAIPSYGGNIRRLFDWSFIAAVPDQRTIYFLPTPADLTGNGHPDLLVPGADGYALFEGAADEQFTRRHQFSTINPELDPSDLPAPAGRFSTEVSFNERDGLVIKANPRSASLFEDFLSDAGDVQDNTLLDTSRWMPPALLADMTAVGAQDIVFLNIGNDIRGQLNIWQRGTQGGSPGEFSPRPTWQGPVDMEGDFHLLDLNGDGLSDVMRMVESSDTWDVHFYVNQGGHFNLDRPDQVMRFSGYNLRIEVTDILRNGKPQLSVTYYTIPVVNAIRNTSIIRTQLLYGSNNTSGDQLFSARPDFRLDESYSASAVLGFTIPAYLQADINGNGRADALYLTPEGTLAAKTISETLQFSAQPFWTYVPQRTVVGFDVLDMNSDGKPDLVLHHSNTTTVLVSTP